MPAGIKTLDRRAALAPRTGNRQWTSNANGGKGSQQPKSVQSSRELVRTELFLADSRRLIMHSKSRVTDNCSYILKE
ncbi:hypothetical protein CHS0354_020149 [Potamilus streckersoni]|uniref:Uncharacterized protein n=1 Tax=Potamilus streckersoni TaxID=2493646 RepID=A0AAE0S560_9BIVA|nr:hypothetical protein CHS0354_020149 [Potamilus streckersoni]